jgi:hypothetical protein
LTRRELEEDWVQELVYKYDSEMEEGIRGLVDAYDWMQNSLRQAVDKVVSLSHLATFILQSD